MPEVILLRFYRYLHSIASFSARHRSFAAFVMVVMGVVTLDLVFHSLLFEHYIQLSHDLLGWDLLHPENTDMDFAPEVWLALLSMVLGTLIIVISIASQSIPKLIDLYMQDWTSLFYVWFLIVSGSHAAFIKLYGEIGVDRIASRVLNIQLLLTLSIVLAFPYIFYILKYTKPSNVINKIYRNNLSKIYALVRSRTRLLLNIDSIVEEYQVILFESLNQLDDLLEYVSFKEPKADIIHNMSSSIQEYIRLKKRINPLFFKVSPKVRSDISFKTMIGLFSEMEKTRTFYEQKCLRLLGNVYIKLLENGQFDLASLTAAEMNTIAQVSIEAGDDDMVDVLIIRFNTLLRFAIKHGVKNNEPRNLYNAAFHYGNFVENMVKHRKTDHVKKSFFYLRIYGTEVFKHGHTSKAMYFIVDVFAAEMKRILQQVYYQNWELEIQNGLLTEMLQVDSPPDIDREELDRGMLINNGVRVLQMGLALFYMRENMRDFVLRIAHDILDDFMVLGEETFRKVVEGTCFRLKISGPTFWEDTDRGNLNIYFTSDQDYIESFKELIYHEMDKALFKHLNTRFSLNETEYTLLGEMANIAPQLALSNIAENVQVFEKRILALSNHNQERLNLLLSLRRKFNFHSNNPELRLTSSRQLAVSLVMEAILPRKGKSPITTRAVINANYLNFFYVKMTPVPEEFEAFQGNEFFTFRFTPPLQKYTYQLETSLAGQRLQNGLFKFHQVDNVTVIAEK